MKQQRYFLSKTFQILKVKKNEKYHCGKLQFFDALSEEFRRMENSTHSSQQCIFSVVLLFCYVAVLLNNIKRCVIHPHHLYCYEFALIEPPYYMYEISTSNVAKSKTCKRVGQDATYNREQRQSI